MAFGPALTAQAGNGTSGWVFRGEALDLKFPPAEHLGLVGLGAMRTSANGLFVGPLLLSAWRGERGGFFATGLEGGWRTALAPHWGLSMGLFVGGGGGASTPVGGGFLVRPRVGLDWEWENQRLGLDLTHIRFPGGAIASTQATLRWEWVVPVSKTGKETEVSPGFLEVRGLRQTGPKSDPPLDRISLTYGRFLDDTFSVFLEGSGAVRGRNAGYMNVFGGMGARLFLDGDRRMALRALLGAGSGGGGGLDTGGGFLIKGSAGLQVQVGPALYLLAEAGRIAAPAGSFRGTEFTLGVGLPFGLARVGTPGHSQSPGSNDSEWWFSAGFQHWRSAARRAGAPDQFLEQLVLKVEAPLTEQLYATGQTGWATGGGAGAWATGLLGLGAQTPSWRRHRLRVELAAGAGGGGGVESRGGAMAQAMAGWTWDFTSQGRAHLLGGRVWSLQHGFASPLIEAGFGFRTGFRAQRILRP